MVPAWQKSEVEIHASKVRAVVGKSCWRWGVGLCKGGGFGALSVRERDGGREDGAARRVELRNLAHLEVLLEHDVVAELQRVARAARFGHGRHAGQVAVACC